MVFCRRVPAVPPPVPIIVFVDRTTIDQFRHNLEPVQITVCTFARRTTLDQWGLVPLGQSQLDTRGEPHLARPYSLAFRDVGYREIASVRPGHRGDDCGPKRFSVR
jgi:hypothetical protein